MPVKSTNPLLKLNIVPGNQCLTLLLKSRSRTQNYSFNRSAYLFRYHCFYSNEHHKFNYLSDYHCPQDLSGSLAQTADSILNLQNKIGYLGRINTSKTVLISLQKKVCYLSSLERNVIFILISQV